MRVGWACPGAWVCPKRAWSWWKSSVLAILILPRSARTAFQEAILSHPHNLCFSLPAENDTPPPSRRSTVKVSFSCPLPPFLHRPNPPAHPPRRAEEEPNPSPPAATRCPFSPPSFAMWKPLRATNHHPALFTISPLHTPRRGHQAHHTRETRRQDEHERRCSRLRRRRPQASAPSPRPSSPPARGPAWFLLLCRLCFFGTYMTFEQNCPRPPQPLEATQNRKGAGGATGSTSVALHPPNKVRQGHAEEKEEGPRTFGCRSVLCLFLFPPPLVPSPPPASLFIPFHSFWFAQIFHAKKFKKTVGDPCSLPVCAQCSLEFRDTNLPRGEKTPPTDKYTTRVARCFSLQGCLARKLLLCGALCARVRCGGFHALSPPPLPSPWLDTRYHSLFHGYTLPPSPYGVISLGLVHPRHCRHAGSWHPGCGPFHGGLRARPPPAAHPPTGSPNVLGGVSWMCVLGLPPPPPLPLPAFLSQTPPFHLTHTHRVGDREETGVSGATAWAFHSFPRL